MPAADLRDRADEETAWHIAEQVLPLAPAERRLALDVLLTPVAAAALRECLRAGLAFTRTGQWRDAGAVLSKAMATVPASLKGQVAAALEEAAPHSEGAGANLAFALLSADGVPRDVGRARALFASVAVSGETELHGYAHNWLAHIAAGTFGGRRKPAAALAHFEQAARAGHGKAAFNAGFMHDEGTGVPRSEGRQGLRMKFLSPAAP